MAKALRDVIENHGVRIEWRGIADGEHAALFMEGSEKPDYAVYGYRASGDSIALDDALRDIYTKLGLEVPNFSISTTKETPEPDSAKRNIQTSEYRKKLKPS